MAARNAAPKLKISPRFRHRRLPKLLFEPKCDKDTKSPDYLAENEVCQKSEDEGGLPNKIYIFD